MIKNNLTVKVGNSILANNEYEILENTYKNNIRKGTASVQIKGVGENYGGTATVKFKIGTKRFQWVFPFVWVTLASQFYWECRNDVYFLRKMYLTPNYSLKYLLEYFEGMQRVMRIFRKI